MGRNAHEVMWDDSIGYGLQMALFDAVGKALHAVHALLGEKVRDRAKLSWWAIDMPAADWASECRDALELGYRDFKTKGRPWHDIYAQMDAMQEIVPDDFRIDMDFNATLLDADHAIPIFQRLEKTYQDLAICEGPINDLEDSRRLRKAVDLPIAHHGGSLGTLIPEDYCDGYVLGGGASAVLREGTVCGAFDKPFWLQMVGSDITAVYSMHLAAVLSHANWPPVNTHQLYAQGLLSTPIEVSEGTAPIPDASGLGFEIDEDALTSLRLSEPYEGYDPPRLIEPNGAKFY